MGHKYILNYFNNKNLFIAKLIRSTNIIFMNLINFDMSIIKIFRIIS